MIYSRFENVFACLQELRRTRPECQSEVDMALGMIAGTRPGIEAKYDALLLRLDRTYSRLMDERDRFERIRLETKLAQERIYAKTRVRSCNKMLSDIVWMRARNRDMIDAAKAILAKAGPVMPASVSETTTATPDRAAQLKGQ